MNFTKTTEFHQNQRRDNGTHGIPFQPQCDLSSSDSTSISSISDDTMETSLSTQSPQIWGAEPDLIERDREDVIIAVIGKTGCGKSKFISKFSTRDSADVPGHNISTGPCFAIEVEHMIPGYRLLLIDTPGFNDTVNENIAVLKRIRKWLKISHHGKSLSGLIYARDIKDEPIRLSSIEYFKYIRKITGGDMSNVILLTTKWDSLGANQHEGDSREADLREKSNFWKGMIADGANIMRHDDTPESAERVIYKLLDKQVSSTSAHEEVIKLRRRLKELAEAKQEEYISLRTQFQENLIEIKEDHEQQLKRWEVKSQDQQNELEKQKVVTTVAVAVAVIAIVVALWM